MRMKKREGRLPKKRDGNLPKGVMRRETTRELVCDVRFTHCNVKGKFHATQIESLEEGAFFYDIVKLYEWRLRGGSRRRRLLELNYPEVSSSLNLVELPKDFHIKHNKEQVQKLILEQARRAARGLIQSQKCSRHVGDGSQSTLNDQTSPHQNAQGIKPGVPEDQLDLAGIDASPGVQRLSRTHMYDTFQHNVDQVHTICMDFQEKVCELLKQCCDQYKLKVTDRKELERKVAGINEAWGSIISLPNLEPEVFHECVAFIKQIIRGDGELFWSLERFELAYKSEESKCWELRKRLEGELIFSVVYISSDVVFW